jgi:APA family basic amino acid/polyamine antiporter
LCEAFFFEAFMNLQSNSHGQNQKADFEEEHELRRALGPWHLVSFGVGAIIGAGIFVITGHAAAAYAGPGVAVSFVLASVCCLFAGLCYAEYASMIPVAGSAYSYTHATLGRFLAWIIGWNLVLEYLVSSSTVAVGWAGYFNALLAEIGLRLPSQISQPPFKMNEAHELFLTGAWFDLPAMVIVALCTVFLVVGVHASARFNAAMVVVKLTIILMVIGFGLPLVKASNLEPFIPPNTGEWGSFGWSGVLRATGVIFFAYIGFDSVSAAAQEARNPQRDIPIGILGSLLICTALYVLMAVTMTGLAPYATLNVAHPVSAAVSQGGPDIVWLGSIVNIAAVVGLSSVVLVTLLGQARIFYAMSRDGLAPRFFSRIHPTYRTPWLGSIVTGVIAAALAAVCPLDVLGELVSIGTLAAFAVVCTGILVLRRAAPDAERPFRTPFVWFVAPAGILTCVLMMAALPIDTWLRLLIWTAIGLIIYWSYGAHREPRGKWRPIKSPLES